jgi:hypothetical protein
LAECRLIADCERVRRAGCGFGATMKFFADTASQKMLARGALMKYAQFC